MILKTHKKRQKVSLSFIICHLSFCVALILLLAACAGHDEDGTSLPSDDMAVSFTTTLDGDDGWADPVEARATRATTGPINSLEDLKALTYGFGVFAYSTNTTLWADAISGKAVNDANYPIPDFMLNQSVIWDVLSDRTTSDWTYEPLKYWPNSTNNATPRYISFFAYSPWTYSNENGDMTEGIVKMTNSTDKSPHVEFVQAASPSLQTDLLWANFTNATRNGNGLIVVDNNGSKTYQRVPLSFKHALACVEVYVQRIYDEPTYSGNHPEQEKHTKLFISKLKLQNTVAIINSGKLNLSTGSWDSDSGDSNDMTFDVSAINDAISSSDMTEKWPLTGYGTDQELRPLFKERRPLMLIPQELTLTPTLTYTMLTQDNSLELSTITDSEGNKYARIDHEMEGNPVRLTLQSGKKYRLVLHIGVETVRFEVESVEDWDFPMRFNPESVGDYQEEEKERTINE